MVNFNVEIMTSGFILVINNILKTLRMKVTYLKILTLYLNNIHTKYREHTYSYISILTDVNFYIRDDHPAD
jgi:hypothetical protein